MEHQKIEIAPKSVFIVILIMLGFLFVYEVRSILMIVFIAIVLAAAFDPLVSYLQKNKIPRALSVVLIYIIVAALVGWLFYSILPPLIEETLSFAGSFSSYYNKFIKILGSYKSLIPFTSRDILTQIPEYIKGEEAGGVVQFFAGVVGGAVHAVTILVVSMYLLIRDHGISRFLRYVTPLKNEAYVLDLWSRVKRKLGAWFLGQLVLGLTIGILVFVGLTILGIKYALVLAVLAGIFELVPMVGPILSAIPGVAVAFSQSPVLGLMVLALYVLAQQTENHIIVPLVMKKAVGLDPVIVIVSLLTGATLGGVIGMIIAVPLATIIVEIFADFIEKKPMEAEIL
jgi:predicted PurR-regulated permease PerM